MNGHPPNGAPLKAAQAARKAETAKVANVAKGAPLRRRGRPSRRPPSRDMELTPFGAILAELIARVPGAYAASLVDTQGESVDYAGLAEPFDVKVAGAHLQILLRNLAELEKLGVPRTLTIRGARRSIIARQLPDDYVLVVLLRRGAGFTASRRAYDVCERSLADEAGWPRVPGAGGRFWYPVEVTYDQRGRPRSIKVRKAEIGIEVLGAVMGLPPRERGFRVRTASGTELTLVREARCCWYADEPVDELE